jgi:hypothetical protein
VDVGEAELLEAVEEPGGADGFAEGWRGNADEFELPLAELGLMEVQPVEGAMHGGEGGEMCDAALRGGGGGHQEFTSTSEVSAVWRYATVVSLRSITHPLR